MVLGIAVLIKALDWVLGGVVGNRADQAVQRFLADPAWQDQVRDVVERMEDVELDRKGFRAWLGDPATGELLARYEGREDPPDGVAGLLIDSLGRHRVVAGVRV